MWKRYEDPWWTWDRFQALLKSLNGTKIGTLIFLMIKYLPYRSYYISIWINHPTASKYASFTNQLFYEEQIDEHNLNKEVLLLVRQRDDNYQAR